MSKGYFSLVQYCPDIARQEAVNVGVILLYPERNFIDALMAANNWRVQHFFGKEADGYRHLNALKDAMRARVKVEAAQFRDLPDLERFAATRANKMVLTAPKFVRVENPAADLRALFDELVAQPEKPLSIQTVKPLRQRLDEALGAERLKPILQRDVRVTVPAFNRPLEVPYGFQNGRFHLIQPVEFPQKNGDAVARAACFHAVEGYSLYQNPDPERGPLQLVVVADFPNVSAEAVPAVRQIFAENSVQLFTPETLNELAEEVATQGKPAAGA